MFIAAIKSITKMILIFQGLLIKQFNNIATNQQYTKFAAKESISTMSGSNDDRILIEYEDTNEDAVFSAKPAYVDDDETDKKIEEIIESAYSNTLVLDTESTEHDEPAKSPTNLSVDNSYISSSSLEDSIKIYNVQTGEIVKCKPEDNLSRYESVTDGNENIDITDNDSGDADDKLSENLELGEDTVIIEDCFEDEDELSEKNSEVDDILAQLPKVKELAKRFVSMENVNEPAKVSIIFYLGINLMITKCPIHLSIVSTINACYQYLTSTYLLAFRHEFCI